MKTRLLLPLLLAVLAMWLNTSSLKAIPVDPDIWHTITLTDGSSIRAQLMGDEWFSFYRDAEGNVYTLEVNTPAKKQYAKRNTDFMAARVKAANELREADAVNVVAHPQPIFKGKSGMKKTLNAEDFDAFRGKKKGLIILVNFQDVQYTTNNPKAFYDKVANELNYKQGNYQLSIRDYFLKQSYGNFDLTFDVVGPVTVSEDMAYYGAPQGSSNDKAAGAMIKEAVQLVNDSVNFSDYDWNGDGQVENVFILYAGHNQAEGGGENTIWPHKWTISAATGSSLTLQGMTINIYACSSEFRGSSGSVNCGIGTFCHEFSHCMGFPDLYDTSYSGNIGVGAWDLMASGNYRGNGFNPIDYSGFEKWTAGWLEPIELTEPVQVKNMKTIENNGELYVIDCGSTTEQEFYILENRNVPNMYPYNENPRGLLITHIDYNYRAWYYNAVNSFTTYYEYENGRWVAKTNNHLRWKIMPADNKLEQYSSQAGDVYPYSSGGTSNTSLTNTSTPMMVWYNGTDTESALADKGITNITRNSDGTINFNYRDAGSNDATYTSLFFDERNTSEMNYEAGTYNINTNILFPNHEWRAVWLPFDMSNSELRATLGNNVKVAYFTNINKEGDGITEVNFVTSTEGIKAFTPCIIKVDNYEWEYTEIGLIEQKEVLASSNNPEQTIGDYTFSGIKKAGIVNMNDCYHFYNDNEELEGIHPMTEYLMAYDAIFKTNGARIDAYTFDKVVTKIDGVDTDVVGINKANIYDLNGNIVRKNAKNTDGLAPGVYVFMGRKIVVK